MLSIEETTIVKSNLSSNLSLLLTKKAKYENSIIYHNEQAGIYESRLSELTDEITALEKGVEEYK